MRPTVAWILGFGFSRTGPIFSAHVVGSPDYKATMKLRSLGGTSGTERYGTKREIGVVRYFLINGQISMRYSCPYSRDSAEFVARLEQDLGRPLAPRPSQQTRV